MCHVVGSAEVKVPNSSSQSVEKVTKEKPDLCVLFIGDFFASIVCAFQKGAFVVELFKRRWLVMVSCPEDSEN